MTADKNRYEHHCPLEERVKGIEGDVRDIRQMAAGMYEKLGEFSETLDAVHEAVTYHEQAGVRSYAPDEDWDFLDEE